MSALPSKADSCSVQPHVRFVRSFDHAFTVLRLITSSYLVGACQGDRGKSREEKCSFKERLQEQAGSIARALESDLVGSEHQLIKRLNISNQSNLPVAEKLRTHKSDEATNNSHLMHS